MKKLITLIILSLSLNGMAQNGHVKTHTVGLEGGLWSRGLVGASYEYNFLRKEWFFLSVHGSVGAGLDLHSTNYYSTLAPSFNFGRGTFHVFAGPEMKYLRLGDLLGNHQGLAVGGFGGVGFYYESGMCLKIRGSVDRVYSETRNGNKLCLPGIGVSVGYSFGKK